MTTSNLKSLIEKTKKLNILYVEDNEETRAQAIKIFDNFFEQIDVAVDGLDGLNKYKAQQNNYYDLIISDINMPNMNGIDMAKAIYKINDQQNILIITAHNKSDNLEKLIKIGIKNYIHKPIRMDSLIQELHKIVEILDKNATEEEEFNEITRLNQELDALVDSFDNYVIASRTDLKGKITYASKAYEEISGYKEEELLGKPHNIVRHPDMPASAFKELWNTIQAGKLWVGEVLNLKKDGGFYWVDAHIAPYYDGSGKHVGYSAIRLDITSKKRAEALNEEIINLLNNAGQGFLSFDKDMNIDESFSQECLNIFNTDDIFNKNIANLLFDNDNIKKDLFEDGISKTLEVQEDMMKSMLLSLLPTEHTINNKDIKIEYKLLQNDKFMLVLTDITNTKKLQSKIKEQTQIQKMIVSVASNKNDFIELRFEFENFLANPSTDIKTLLRQLHTFKGIFAQKEMAHIAYAIHELETLINNAIITNNANVVEILEIFLTYNLEQYFQIELKLIEEALGKEFLDMVCSLNIDMETLDNLESKIKQLESKETHNEVTDILADFEKIKYETVFHMLSTYPIAIQKMSQKLDKEIYPLEIVDDKNIKISSQFKPFFNTLIHLFNNCVEHGIEDIETRVENNKDEIGTIECKYEIIDNNLQIIISDDGAGINIDKLTQSAIKNNIKNSDDLSSMSDKEKLFLVFADNLSTNDVVSTTSGRGVGMSAIKDEVEKLNGNIEIKNSIGSGVKFIFTLPLDI